VERLEQFVPTHQTRPDPRSIEINPSRVVAEQVLQAISGFSINGRTDENVIVCAMSGSCGLDPRNRDAPL
jgi:hypothetical protein